jgi:1,4-dihydroxy-2-naphthoate octaprenyltransferase
VRDTQAREGGAERLPPRPVTVWWEAARPRTLSAALAPVIVGTAAAGSVTWWRFAAALVVAVAVQVAVNFANDYSDGIRGVDTPQRVGPRRAVASGLVTPGRMRVAVALALGVAALAGVALAAATTWWLLAVGAAAFVAALGYSGGPRPYASAGLGEVFVFVFFGLVATVGSTFVQVEQIPPASVAAAVPVGFLAVAILVANNLRDIGTDREAGKRTLAVRIGEAATRRLLVGLLLGAFPLAAAVAVVASTPWPLLALGASPFARGPVRAVLGGASGPGLVRVLVATARLQVAFAVLLAAGLAAGLAGPQGS